MSNHESLAKLDREIEQLDGTIERLGERLPANQIEISLNERFLHGLVWVFVLFFAVPPLLDLFELSRFVGSPTMLLGVCVLGGSLFGIFISPYLLRLLRGDFHQDTHVKQRRQERKALMAQQRERLVAQREELRDRLKADMAGQISLSIDTSAQGGLALHDEDGSRS